MPLTTYRWPPQTQPRQLSLKAMRDGPQTTSTINSSSFQLIPWSFLAPITSIFFQTPSLLILSVPLTETHRRVTFIIRLLLPLSTHGTDPLNAPSSSPPLVTSATAHRCLLSCQPPTSITASGTLLPQVQTQLPPSRSSDVCSIVTYGTRYSTWNKIPLPILVSLHLVFVIFNTR